MSTNSTAHDRDGSARRGRRSSTCWKRSDGFRPWNRRISADIQFSLIDLNNATAADRVMLPEIDVIFARKTIDGRLDRTKTHLVARNIVPAATYAKIEGWVIAPKPLIARALRPV